MKKPNEVKIGDITLQEIIDRHSHWINRDCDNDDLKEMRADLSGMDLQYIDFGETNLCHAILRDANLSHSNLYNANLSLADLSNSNLSDCYLYNADLSLANLESSNLYKADLSDADLSNSDLSGCCLMNAELDFAYLDHANLTNSNLSYASLRSAHLYGANLSNAVIEYADFTNSDITKASFDNAIGNNIEYRKGKILSESIIGYKKCKSNRKYGCFVIVTLEIPKDAIVFSINGGKCRTNKAKVISINSVIDESSEFNRAYSLSSITPINFNYSCEDLYLSYYKGDEINIKNFNCQYNVECSNGIHFFMTKEEAIKYRHW